MNARILGGLAASMLALAACSEPDKRVVSHTGDGAFRLALEADRNWVRPRGELPVLVRLEHLGGPPVEDFEGEIEFAVSGGSVSPSRLSVALAAPDSAGRGGRREFAGRVVFTAAANATVATRAEIGAFFADALATLKVRVVPAAP